MYGSLTARNFVLASWLGSSKRSGAPSTNYFALLYSATADTTLGTEATGGSYARVGILNTDSLWSIASAVATTLVAVTWPVSTASWNSNPLNQWAIYDASTSGTCWAFGELAATINVTVAGRLPTAIAGALTVTQDE